LHAIFKVNLEKLQNSAVFIQIGQKLQSYELWPAHLLQNFYFFEITKHANGFTNIKWGWRKQHSKKQ